MALKEHLEHIFSNDYPGTEVFVDSVIKPIFGDEITPVNDDLASRPEYAARARKAGLKQINYIGDLTEKNYNADNIVLLDVTVEDSKDIERSRVNIQQLVRSIVQQHQHMLIMFHYENVAGKPWRFSYAYKADTIANTTSAKRYTYVFGQGYRGRTAAERFEILAKSQRNNQNFIDAFSVEALSDEFFAEYRKLYANFIEFITGKRVEKVKGKWVEVKKHEPNIEIMQAFKGDEKRVRDYIKKMMGRLTFLYFIQRKGWLNGSQSFMHDLFFKSDKQTNFLDDVLEPLFFGVLNTAENREAMFAENGWDLGLLDQWQSIKYLNGGLFEQTDDDRINCRLPEEYFKDIFEFFEKYNFTIDENDPSDAEVGIDPEMLGRIFESLLEDNKDKGAFYTPKDIVQYMCKASLKQYLLTHVSDAKDLITTLVDKHEIISDNLTIISQIENCLEFVKICDPAIGSGAFPMGLLNEILSCRRTIHTFIHNGDDSLFDTLAVKRQIIHNNIFGVDIEQGAVDIARLRFWLSIVVDSDEPQPLPNLDYTIVRGNSLLTMFQGETLKLSSSVDKRTKIGKELKKLFDLQDKIYDQFGDPELKTAIDIKLKLLEIIELQLGIEQSEAQDIINKTEDSIFDEKKNIRKGNKNLEAKKLLSRKLRAKASIDNLKISLQSTNQSLLKRAQTDIDFFDWNIMFSDIFANGGFDIVIGNPPYFVYEGTHRDEIPALKVNDEYQIAFGGKLNAYKLFLAKAINFLTKEDGNITYIFQNSFLADKQASNLRKEVLENRQIVTIDSFPERDSVKKRVFESAKMSVCVVVLKNASSKLPFVVNIWDDKHKSSGITTVFSLSDIKRIDLENYSIPRIKQENLPLVSKIKGLSNSIFLRCFQGELNMTSHRQYFSSNPEFPKVLKGASIQRYFWTEEMSQGLNETVNEEAYLNDFPNSEKAMHHSSIRIAMQGMTGANDKIRIVATVIESGIYLAHSCNYILPHSDIELHFILGILNSKLINWYFRCFSTNSNVNSYEIESIPFPNIPKPKQKLISKWVVNTLKQKIVDSKSDTIQLESEIDHIVYHLYDLTYDEVLIVDPETPIMREEYENFNIGDLCLD